MVDISTWPPRQLSPHFFAREFRSPRPGGGPRIDVPERLRGNLTLLVFNLEAAREYIARRLGREVPLRIVSGYRSPDYNAWLRTKAARRGRKPGAAKRSKHMDALAADMTSELEPPELYWLFRDAMSEGVVRAGGLACYRTFVHYDARGRNARWNRTPPRPKILH